MITAFATVERAVEARAKDKGLIFVESGTDSLSKPAACPSVPEDKLCRHPGGLLESELFSHEKGAFTGADRAKVSLFGAAAGLLSSWTKLKVSSQGLQTTKKYGLETKTETALLRVGHRF